jgi:hypothetical protein
LLEPDGQKALRCFIAASVHQQLRRPGLMRLLDFEESRPAIAQEIAESGAAFLDLLRQILSRADISPPTHMETTIADLIVIVSALINAAGEQDETDRRDLEGRVGRAVFGYLGVQEPEVFSSATPI